MPPAPKVDALIDDSPVAVQLDAQTPPPKLAASRVVKLVTLDQVVIDGKLHGPCRELMQNSPEFIPVIVDLLKAREDKVTQYHAAVLGGREAELLSQIETLTKQLATREAGLLSQIETLTKQLAAASATVAAPAT